MPSWSRAWGPWARSSAATTSATGRCKDTDGDGLPEFVDAWGQPLQFFRWPLFITPTPRRARSSTSGTIRLTPPRSASRSSSSTRPTFPYSRPASRTRWTPTSSSWRRRGGRRSRTRTPVRRSSAIGGPCRVSRRQRRGAGLRVLLPPAHRASPEYRDAGVHWDRADRPTRKTLSASDTAGPSFQAADPLRAGPTSNWGSSALPEPESYAHSNPATDGREQRHAFVNDLQQPASTRPRSAITRMLTSYDPTPDSYGLRSGQ